LPKDGVSAWQHLQRTHIHKSSHGFCNANT
jgi:hypothetical protein